VRPVWKSGDQLKRRAVGQIGEREHLADVGERLHALVDAFGDAFGALVNITGRGAAVADGRWQMEMERAGAA